MTVLLSGAALVSVGRLLFVAVADVPGATSFESYFGEAGGERFRPAQLFDRTGRTLLAEVSHPLASGRRWQPLDRLPAHVAQAMVAALDPDFWTNPGYDPAGALRVLSASVMGRPVPAAAETISERLAGQLVPLEGEQAGLARLVLAADLGATVPKARVLEWYLNSADYGNLAFGIDAAALVYFGRHAEGLTLGQAALLTGLLEEPAVDPQREAAEARVRQAQVLDRMLVLGMISAAQAAEARREPMGLRSEEALRASAGPGFVGAVWEELSRRVGAGAASQGGLRVVTTIDLDLQLQVDCLTRTQLARMNRGEPTLVLPAADGSHCVAASLLPPVRPGDAGVDHGMAQAAVVVLDPAAGEVLAITGPADAPRTAGSALGPFVYLSAFSRGYTPASMIIDTGAGGRGPMRLRTALGAGYEQVAGQLAERIGPEVVARTLDTMGVEVGDPAAIGSGSAAVPLDDLTTAFGILANRGVLVGTAARTGDAADPTLLREVRSADGRLVYSPAVQSRSILSEGLAFLLNDILADEAVRSIGYGQATLLDTGRPAAVVVGQGGGEEVNWTLGYTPQRVVGVWVGAAPGETLTGVHALNGAAPIWHAALRYALAGLPVAGWTPPAEVTKAEVCDPSGYLPTPYCPNVVKEVFLLGTEPTHEDTLYRPLRINRQTGRLATFFTPLDQVEQRVYFLPPEEAAGWATASGLATPPTEYDRILVPAVFDSDVRLASPFFFDLVRGSVEVRGTASGQGFRAYRLYAGSGLDPTTWIQVGADGGDPVVNGVLGRWDTAGLNGAYILRLAVERDDGTLDVAAVALTVDNREPQVAVVYPGDGTALSAAERVVPIQVEAVDDSGVVRVVILVDGRRVAEATAAPWSARWLLGSAGEHTIRARAYDGAGNWADSDEIVIRVER